MSKIFAPKAPSQAGVPVTPAAGDGSTQLEIPTGEINAFNLPPVSAVPAWPLGLNIELHFYLSTSPYPRDVFSAREKKAGLPSFVWDNIVRDFGSSNLSRVNQAQ